MLKDGWLASFVMRLQELRPEVGQNFAHHVALGEWPSKQKMTPEGAAELWIKGSAKDVVPRKRS